MRLFTCDSCGLSFKNGSPPSRALREYYAALPQEGWWQHPSPPPAWTILARELEQCRGGRVLDIGCYRGDFAHWLGGQWEHFGVEPNRAARGVAETRGVRILADTLESLGATALGFDAVLMCDLIEHLPDPCGAITIAWRHIRPGGQLLVVTGSPDALSWRMARARYWYTVFPEHLVFCSPDWFRWVARRLDARCRVIARVPSVSASPWRRIKESVRSVEYLLSRRRRASPADWIVWWTTAADHVVVCLRKKDAPGQR